MDLGKWLIFGFSVFSWITGVIGFCIIKFNDFSHLENDVKDLEKKQEKYEDKQNERHEENLKALGELATQVSYLCGKQDNQDKE